MQTSSSQWFGMNSGLAPLSSWGAPSIEGSLSDDNDFVEDDGRRALTLDKHGIPIGIMAACFHRDLELFVQELDPTAIPHLEGLTKEAKQCV